MDFMPIFTYHRLTAPSGVNSRFDFSVDAFRSHLEILKASGLRCVVPEDLRANGAQAVENSVMITFDDGYETDYSAALGLLAGFGFRAVTFITANLVNKPGYLSWEKIKELSKAGFSVQSHSLNHRFLSALDHSELLNELRKSKEIIEDKTGVKVDYLAAPGGRVSAAVVKASAEAGYSGIFNSKPGYTLSQESGILVFNRFVLKNSIGARRFRNIANKDPLALISESAAYSAKNLIRKALGKK
ncbi:MAG: polysaccharide deacetylase family protein, partial [Deltaproteobacteria bacterium]|nr:polysaccharide deacetylase family protein [Deltaproteobacteria bacterium]